VFSADTTMACRTRSSVMTIEAIHEDVKKTDQHSIGSFMESYVASRDIDLLVMGAYGHSRLREFVLGGATRSILTNPPCWVMLSH